MEQALSMLAASPPVWAALSAAVSGFFGWYISLRNINASLERSRIKMNLDATAAEVAERSEFRATLMAEMASVRSMMKECESDRDALRARVNAAEGQILVLKASNEIMERWVAFFKEGASPQARGLAAESRPESPALHRYVGPMLGPTDGSSAPDS